MILLGGEQDLPMMKIDWLGIIGDKRRPRPSEAGKGQHSESEQWISDGAHDWQSRLSLDPRSRGIAESFELFLFFPGFLWTEGNLDGEIALEFGAAHDSVSGGEENV